MLVVWKPSLKVAASCPITTCGPAPAFVEPGLEWRGGLQRVEVKLETSSMLQLGLEYGRLLGTGILLRHGWDCLSLRRRFSQEIWMSCVWKILG